MAGFWLTTPAPWHRWAHGARLRTGIWGACGWRDRASQRRCLTPRIIRMDAYLWQLEMAVTAQGLRTSTTAIRSFDWIWQTVSQWSETSLLRMINRAWISMTWM